MSGRRAWWKKWCTTRRVAGGLDTERTVHGHKIDSRVQGVTKNMMERRVEEKTALDRKWLLGTEHDMGSKTI